MATTEDGGLSKWSLVTAPQLCSNLHTLLFTYLQYFTHKVSTVASSIHKITVQYFVMTAL